MTPRGALWLAAGLLGLALPSAWADPMRPLGGGAKNTALRPTAPAAAPAAGEAAAAPAKPSQPRLVAIRQDSQGRWHALFDERWLTIGERLGPQTIAAIDAGQVQLRQGRQTQTLHLLPTLDFDTPKTGANRTTGTAARSHNRSSLRRSTDISTAQTAGEATP